MQAIAGILGFIFIFGLAVLVHELGHFVTARKFGVLCHEFAIGMGPIVWKKRKGETLYTIRAIPIGGFVSMGMNEHERDILKQDTEVGIDIDPMGVVTKIYFKPEDGQTSGILKTNTIDISANFEVAFEIAGERKIYPVAVDAMYIDTVSGREAQIVPTNRRLDNKPKFQRFIIFVSGALMNFVLAYVLVLFVSAIVGEVVGVTNQLSLVNPGGPASIAGLEVGDTILEINGFNIYDGHDIRDAIQSAGNQPTIFIYERNGQKFETLITPDHQPGGYLVGIGFAQEIERSFLGTFREANARFIDGAMMIFSGLRSIATREAGVEDLAGVVGIVHMTSEVAMLGMLPLLIFASIININLGIFNLLPFPALDGGHITFIVIESIIGRPVNPKFQTIISLIGFGLLLLLMIFTVFNDIRRLI